MAKVYDLVVDLYNFKLAIIVVLLVSLEVSSSVNRLEWSFIVVWYSLIMWYCCIVCSVLMWKCGIVY